MTREPPAPFNYHPRGDQFVIVDALNNQLALLDREDLALFVVLALNFYRSDGVMQWTCGHIASAHCAICHQELARRAAELVQRLDDMEGAELGGLG